MAVEKYEDIKWQSQGGERICFTIGEVAEMFSVSESTLRYWEQKTKQLRPRISKKGTRYYHEEHMKIVAKLNYLINDLGFTVAAAAERLNDDEVDKNLLLIEKLSDIQSRLDDLIHHCDDLIGDK